MNSKELPYWKANKQEYDRDRQKTYRQTGLEKKELEEELESLKGASKVEFQEFNSKTVKNITQIFYNIKSLLKV